MLCLSLFVANKSFAQFDVGDSLALVSLYNTTNGPNWYNHDNWLTGPVSSWYGINTFNPGGNNYVVDIDLYNNNLNGYISELFSGLDSLYVLVLAKNNITGQIPSLLSSMTKLVGIALAMNHFTSPIPLSLGSSPLLSSVYLDHNDFTGTFPDTLLKNMGTGYGYSIDSNQFTDIPFVNTFSGTLRCRYNNLTFEDIVPYLQNSNLAEFTYSPQDSIGYTYDTTVIVGDSIVLDAGCGGIGNVYRWKKGPMYVTASDTISTLKLSNIQVAQAGYYYCEVKNPNAPLLTLFRRMIHLQVNLPDAIEERPENLYPMVTYNPANALLKIQLRFPSNVTVKSNLYDMLGRKVMTLYDGNATFQDLHYYLNSLKPGIYLVNLQYKGQQTTTRILIK